MTKVRSRTIRKVHRQLGGAAEPMEWPGSHSSLRQYLVVAGPEHWWLGGKKGRARRLMVNPGYLASRIHDTSLLDTLLLWRALGEKRCVKDLVANTEECANDPRMTAVQWASLGDFLRVGSHRRTAEPFITRALRNKELAPIDRARLMRAQASAMWETGTTESETERAIHILEDALALLRDAMPSDNQANESERRTEELALAAHLATVASDVDDDHGRRRYEAVLRLQEEADVSTKSTRMNLANAHHHADELDTAMELLAGVAAELDASPVHGRA
jgi:hypothetical protein